MIQTFNPSEAFISVGGALLTGFAPQMVSVERDIPAVFDELGTEGEIARYLSNDRRGNIIFSLLATSISNTILSTFINADEVIGANIFPTIITDGASNSNELVVAPICWVLSHAPISYSNGVGIRNWTIRSTSIRITEGRT
jgi:hypothetical protein